MNIDILSIIIILVLVASIIYTLYKKKYPASIGIGIMLVVYLLIKSKIGLN